MEQKNYTLSNIGKLKEISNHSIKTPNGEMKGKIFLKSLTQLTVMEVSFQSLPAQTKIPFFHSHKENEELYIILSGNGELLIDNDVLKITEGSCVRISTKGKRCVNNNSKEELIFIVIQAKENSLKQWTLDDGIIEDI